MDVGAGAYDVPGQYTPRTGRAYPRLAPPPIVKDLEREALEGLRPGGAGQRTEFQVQEQKLARKLAESLESDRLKLEAVRESENRAFYDLDLTLPESAVKDFVMEARKILHEYRTLYTDPAMHGGNILSQGKPFHPSVKPMLEELEKFQITLHDKVVNRSLEQGMATESLVPRKVAIEMTPEELDVALKQLGRKLHESAKSGGSVDMVAERIDALIRNTLYDRFGRNHPNGQRWSEVKAKHSADMKSFDAKMKEADLPFKAKTPIDPELDYKAVLTSVRDSATAKSVVKGLAESDSQVFKEWKHYMEMAGAEQLKLYAPEMEMRMFGTTIRPVSGGLIGRTNLMLDPLWQAMSMARGPVYTGRKLSPAGVGVSVGGIRDEVLGTEAEHRQRDISRMSEAQRDAQLRLMHAVAGAEEEP